MVMPVRLSVAIMHVPDVVARAETVRRMLRGLHGLSRVTLVQDPDRRGTWPTAKRAWQSGVVAKGTHHLVLQDDVELCVDFVPQLLRAVAQRPLDVIAPYANRAVIEEAEQLGLSWVGIPDGAWGQAILLPTPWVAEFLQWERRWVRPEWEAFKGDDTRVVLWMYCTGRIAWATVPSLVQHLMPADSTIGFNNPKRVARRYRRLAGSLDWTRGVVGRGLVGSASVSPAVLEAALRPGALEARQRRKQKGGLQWFD
jgi:hypothetical protein